MTERPCPRCQRDDLDADTCRARPACVTHHGTHHLDRWGVCADCQTRVDQQLADILDLHALANAPAALHPPVGEHTASGVRRDPPAPVNLAALDLAIGADALAVLEQWERWWREHWDLTPYGQATETLPRPHRPSDATLTHVIGFLRAWWPRASQVVEPPPDEFADEVQALHGQALAALNLHEPRPWSVACPTDGCGKRLTVDHDGRDAVLRCPRCHVTRTIANLLYVARTNGQPCWLDAEAAARALGVTGDTVRRMAARGDLRARGHGQTRQYDIAGGTPA